MYDTIKVIRLSDLKDVKDFVRAAEDCDFEIDVKYNRTMIDAKSSWHDRTGCSEGSDGLLRWPE